MEWLNKIIIIKYCDENVRFEGELLNGMINEKGKEYDVYDGYLKFEGEYVNGNKNGKEYINNHLIFEGEYSNGIRNGKGKNI